ncbi:MAG: helix-turn-helix transcriptional regulator [Gemmatimonadetes bacterium]|nr:helix-turn-helix transcriptional regulator [Gemmatimonadota bacterium]MCA9768883.1 helix-turn-helix transcriptional regulator [Gemmatimonadota bacterium]MCB9504992.1 helix-turn-helix transcriptional regulator [Gemmatimonadales bacterium]
MVTATPRRTRRPSVDLDRLTGFARATADPTRAAVLELLRFGERCVCDLQSDLDIAQSRLSFHLRVLREAGLVVDRKEGRWSYYALNLAALDAYRDLVAALRPGTGALPVRSEECCG